MKSTAWPSAGLREPCLEAVSALINKETEVDKTIITHLENDCSNPYYHCFHLFLCLDGALRRLLYTEVCIGLDIAHFPSLMYGFIMQQEHL